MEKYPKIETVYDRMTEKPFKVLPEQLRLAEYANIKTWMITEKIHGMNIVIYRSRDGGVSIMGRELEKSQMPIFLLTFLQKIFTPLLLDSVFPQPDGENWPEVHIYGEGYGLKIQQGGGNYRSDPGFRIFDVKVGPWWLNWAGVVDVAEKLGVKTVPVLGFIETIPTTKAELWDLLRWSEVALEENDGFHHEAEGIVARTDPLLMTRGGDRLMWKLKARDF